MPDSAEMPTTNLSIPIEQHEENETSSIGLADIIDNLECIRFNFEEDCEPRYVPIWQSEHKKKR